MFKKDSVAGMTDNIIPVINNIGCSALRLNFEGADFPTEFIIRDIPQGEKDDTTPFARSQKSSLSRFVFGDAAPVAMAQAMQKIHDESISENTRKLLFELRVGLFENAATPTPATKSDNVYKICGLTNL